MKSIQEYLFTDFIELHEGVYIAEPENFWTFLSAGPYIEQGVCDWWHDVAAVYPTQTIVFYPVDTRWSCVPIGPETIYRGVKELDEETDILCHYAVIETERL